MLEFKDTGLPNDPMVISAFMTHLQDRLSQPHMQEEKPNEATYEIKIAQLLHKFVGNDPQLLSFVLVSSLPPETWGLAEKRFGNAVAELLREADSHTQTGKTYLDQASDPLKLAELGAAIIGIEGTEKTLTQQSFFSGNPVAGDMAPPLVLTDMKGYELLFEAATGKTSCPALEELYAEKYALISDRIAEQKDRLNILASGYSGQPVQNSTDKRRFKDSGLPEDPQLSAAFDIVTHHRLAYPGDVDIAIEAARILSRPEIAASAATVSAALLDIGIRTLSQYDLKFLNNILHWDTLDILEASSVYNLRTEEQFTTAAPEHRLICVAESIASMQETLKFGQDFAALGAGSLKNIPPDFIQAQLQQVYPVLTYARKVILPKIELLDNPALKSLFIENYTALDAFTQAQNLNGPKLPKPDFGNPDFKN